MEAAKCPWVTGNTHPQNLASGLVHHLLMQLLACGEAVLHLGHGAKLDITLNTIVAD